MNFYQKPPKSFGKKHDQRSNIRRVLICITNRYHIDPEFLQVDEDEYKSYFDALTQEGYIYRKKNGYQYMAEGYVISPKFMDFAADLTTRDWKKALQFFESAVFALTAFIQTVNSCKA